MARALRIERPGGRYHVSARGNERKPIFREFLESLADLGERFAARVHAHFLMDNPFHLLLDTAEANLSRAMQWVGVRYSVGFNRRHQRVGHLFQGRLHAVVEEDAGWQEVARYVRLNPVRIAGLGLGKRQAHGWACGPGGQARRGGLGGEAPNVAWVSVELLPWLRRIQCCFGVGARGVAVAVVRGPHRGGAPGSGAGVHGAGGREGAVARLYLMAAIPNKVNCGLAARSLASW